MKKIKARSIFISDLHLGSRHCQVDNLLEFLKSIECDTLYLVGDIIDIWAMKSKGFYWPPTHNRVLSRLLRLSKKTDIVYVVGNHDEYIRQFVPNQLGFIDICNEKLHLTGRGQKLLVTHGDLFDPIVCNHKWMAKIGGRIYEWLITFNRVFNKVRRSFGLPYWSLSKYVKRKAKTVTGIIENFQGLLLDHAKKKGYEGVVCGHIHSVACNEPKGYYNCGDWVESCTALIEDEYGNISVFEFDNQD